MGYEPRFYTDYRYRSDPNRSYADEYEHPGYQRAGSSRRFVRRRLSGVCAALAMKMGWRVSLIRIATVIGFFVAPALSILSYLVGALVVSASRDGD